MEIRQRAESYFVKWKIIKILLPQCLKRVSFIFSYYLRRIQACLSVRLREQAWEEDFSTLRVFLKFWHTLSDMNISTIFLCLKQVPIVNRIKKSVKKSRESVVYANRPTSKLIDVFSAGKSRKRRKETGVKGPKMFYTININPFVKHINFSK